MTLLPARADCAPMKTPILAAALVAVLLAGCSTTGGGDVAIYGDADGGTLTDGQIRQAGSSTVYPLAELWAQDFGQARGIQFSVEGGGSGAGASKLCAKEVDLGDLSRQMKDSEKQTCRANGVEPMEWWVAYDGLSVVVGRDNGFVQDLTVEQLAHLFRKDGHARTWDEVDPSFPARPVKLCYPDADSGTYEYFNEAVLEQGAPRTGTGVQQSSEDNVLVTCLAREPDAIGYFGYAYVVENEDKVRAIEVEGVAPSPGTIADGSYTPLSRPIYMYTDGTPEGVLRDYLNYAYHPDGGQALVDDAGYVPLDDDAREEMLAQLGESA